MGSARLKTRSQDAVFPAADDEVNGMADVDNTRDPQEGLSTGPSRSPAAGERGHRVERAGDTEPLPLEPESEREARSASPGVMRGRPVAETSTGGESLPPRSVREYDICPNCGASMRESSTLVCMECGFDLKTMKVIRTRIGAEADREAAKAEAARARGAAADEEPEVPRAPLSMPGRGGWQLPAAMGILGGAAVSIGFLLAARGLFPMLEEGAAIGFAVRMKGLATFIVFSAMEFAAGIAAVHIAARLLETTVGDGKLAMIRIAGIVGLTSVVLLLGLDSPRIEVPLELMGKVGLSFGLAMLLFKLEAREAGIVTLGALMAFFLLWLGIKVVGTLV
jgi:hypothetical protein